jgi:hypothetical protein
MFGWASQGPHAFAAFAIVSAPHPACTLDVARALVSGTPFATTGLGGEIPRRLITAVQLQQQM